MLKSCGPASCDVQANPAGGRPVDAPITLHGVGVDSVGGTLGRPAWAGAASVDERLPARV